MRKSALMGSIAAALLLGSAAADAGPWEDGMVAYNRSDYLPAIRLFRPLAEQGNPKAQNQIGMMYRKGGRGPAESGPCLYVVQPCRQTWRRQGQGRLA
jgi:TPR repeat protein